MTDKSETLDNIDRLISILENGEHDIINDVSPLYQLKNVLERSELSRGLHYTLDDLKFSNVSEKQFVCGGVWESNTLDVRLHLDIYLFPNTYFEHGNVKTSIVEITYEAITHEYNTARGAWHLDCHDYTGIPEFIHPNIHIHHGGRRIKDRTENYGELVLLDAPRLMHPPLDLFLAFDMLLTNFFERRVWSNFRADPSYQEILKSSQRKWWEKYYTQVSDYWKYSTSGVDDIQKRQLAQLANPYLFV